MGVRISPPVRRHKLFKRFKMKKVIQYIEESYDEILNKVTWPTYAELQSSSVLVLIASLIFALIVFFIDVVFDRASSLLYQSF